MMENRDIRLDSGNTLCFVAWECWWPGVSKTVRPHTEISLKGFFPIPTDWRGQEKLKLSTE